MIGKIIEGFKTIVLFVFLIIFSIKLRLGLMNYKPEKRVL